MPGVGYPGRSSPGVPNFWPRGDGLTKSKPLAIAAPSVRPQFVWVYKPNQGCKAHPGQLAGMAMRKSLRYPGNFWAYPKGPPPPPKRTPTEVTFPVIPPRLPSPKVLIVTGPIFASPIFASSIFKVPIFPERLNPGALTSSSQNLTHRRHRRSHFCSNFRDCVRHVVCRCRRPDVHYAARR